jgi:peptidoglycan/xylan/chitin deacetylase (PgdA/CDA1 family)
MLLTFLYHRINSEKYSNPWMVIEENIKYLAKNHKIIVPEDKISFFEKDVCLSFDDGYFDFYYYIYPLLQKLNIKAVLAIPVKFIIEDTDMDPKKRLAVPYNDTMKGDVYREKVPFCTWRELNEMVKSGHVHVASHSYTHQNLTRSDIDLDLEIIESKRILQEKLNIDISTFVYPLGKFNKEIHEKVKKHYKYAFRIGTSWNKTWNNFNGLTYRIISDFLTSKDQHLKFPCNITYLWFYLINTLRGR